MKQLDQDLQHAYTIHQAGKLTQAITEYNAILSVQPQNNIAWHYLGLAYAQMQKWQDAIIALKQALNLSPTTILYIHLAQAYIQQHDNVQALANFHAALQLTPDSLLAHYQLGIFFFDSQQIDAAKTQFNNVITLCPENAQAWFYLGMLHMQTNALSDAEQALQHSYNLDPECVETIVNLGVLALKLEQGQNAINWFTHALTLDPKHILARSNLAATFIHYERFENALVYYDELLQEDKNNAEYLYNAGVAEMTLGRLHKAATYFERLLTHDSSQSFAALTNLAVIQLKLGHTTYATNLLQRAHTVSPTDPTTNFMLSALTCKHLTQACIPYVTNLFDNYAAYYEQHLQDVLQYNIPQCINTIISKYINNNNLHTLDLGCGTGLSGVHLRTVSAHLTGVDLSNKMLTKARSKGIYDKLITSEIIEFLQQNQEYYNLIVAADVLPYLGELNLLFQCINARLTNNGYFMFTIEISHSQEFSLQSNMRFCHNPNYIQQLTSQYSLRILYQQKIIARKQQTTDVYVLLYLLQKL